MAINRSRMNLGNRYQQQFDSRDEGGARSNGVLGLGKVPGGVTYYKTVVGQRSSMNVLPYQIKSKNHPEVVAGRAKVGDWDFVLDIWVHRSLGPNKVDILCPKMTYGRGCPVCEEKNRLYEAKQEKEAKELKASRRVFYNVQPFDKGGPMEEVHVFQVSHYMFAKELMEEANACVNGKGVIPFADVEQGKVVSFRAAEETVGTNKATGYKSFQFLNRDSEISDEVLEKCVSFDEYLVVPTIADLNAAMFGTDEDGPAAEEPPPARREEAPARQRRQDPAEDAPPPARNPPKQEIPPAEEPPPRRRPAPEPENQEQNPCPKGYEYGADCDKKQGCASCPDHIYNACQKAGKGRG